MTGSGGGGDGSAEGVVEEGSAGCGRPGKGTRLPSQFMSRGLGSELVRRMNYCRKNIKPLT